VRPADPENHLTGFFFLNSENWGGSQNGNLKKKKKKELG
jgi:hypothetical protein